MHNVVNLIDSHTHTISLSFAVIYIIHWGVRYARNASEHIMCVRMGGSPLYVLLELCIQYISSLSRL